MYSFGCVSCQNKWVPNWLFEGAPCNHVGWTRSSVRENWLTL